MNEYKQCPQGHYYKGNTCPYCKALEHTSDETVLFNVNNGRTVGTGYTGETVTKWNNGETVTKWNDADKTIVNPGQVTGGAMPRCPHCGNYVRNRFFQPNGNITVSSLNNINDGAVPWNYGWNGRCESCGHDFNIVMNINMGSTGPNNKKKQTIVKACSHEFDHDSKRTAMTTGIRRATALAGVEIVTSCGDNTEKVFLSAKELKYIINALRNSPILEQDDYYVSAYNENRNSGTMFY